MDFLGHAKNKNSITVFFPCYNDAKTIGKLVRDSFKLLRKISKDYEVIVVDDGSTDSSREILKSLAKRYKRLRLVFHPKNLGYGGALNSGFRAASKELIFYTDGDGQYNIFELPLLLAVMGNDTDLVNGIKIVRKDPTYRIVLGNIYNFLVRWLFWISVHDVDCDFRLIRKRLIDKIELRSKSGAVCVELVKKAQRKKARIREVSVSHFERKFGKSQFFKPLRLIKTLKDLLILWVELMVLDKFFRR